jgi:UDP-N-acetylenolpyruvoylglucosamine reductase
MGESVSSQYRIVENAKLDARNTFGVAARAPMLVEVGNTDALPELFGYAMLRDGPVLVLGGGSNLLFAGDPQGVVLALTAQSIAMIEDDGDRAIVRADAASNGMPSCCGRWATAWRGWRTWRSFPARSARRRSRTSARTASKCANRSTRCTRSIERRAR